MRGAGITGTIIAALVAATPAGGALTVLKDDGSEADKTEATVVFDAKTGGWNVTLLALYAPGDFTVYNVHGDAGEVIDNLIIDIPGQIGSPVIVHVISDNAPGIATVRNIRKTGTAETVISTVNVRADIGSVDVDEIGIMNAGRDVIGPVRVRIEEPLRGINTIEAQRDILGDITADDGRIILVLSYGRIGTAETPVTIRAKHNIVQIGSFGGMHGDVNSRYNGGQGRMYAFGATTFDGTLETEGFFANPFTGEPGRLRVLEHCDAEIEIGSSFDDPEQWMELPPSGFTGQIVINADDHPFGAWTSPVYLGPPHDPVEILDGPHYKETAKSIGGGSIGLAPFALHETSCVPVLSGVLAGGPSAVVALRHYGPVRMNDPAPVIIENHVINTGDPWVPVPPSSFEYAPDEADPNTIIVRAAPGQPGFMSGYRYRIMPTANLVSDIPAQPPVVWVRPYVIAVEGNACPSDISGDGVVGMAEMLTILSAWGLCQKCPEDLNGDGMVGYADVIAILRDWGPCT